MFVPKYCWRNAAAFAACGGHQFADTAGVYLVFDHLNRVADKIYPGELSGVLKLAIVAIKLRATIGKCQHPAKVPHVPFQTGYFRVKLSPRRLVAGRELGNRQFGFTHGIAPRMVYSVNTWVSTFAGGS